MADEKDTKDTKLEQDKGTKIPESKQEHDEWVPNDQEQQALAGGWNPDKEEMDDPDAWVSAREFNFRGSLMQRITKQGRTIGTIEQQLVEARNMIAASDRVTQKLISDAVARTRADLRRQKRDALEDDDNLRAEQIDDELDELKDAQRDIKETQDTVPVAPQHQPTPIEAAWFTFVTSTPWAQDTVLNPKLLAHAESLRSANPDMSVESLRSANPDMSVGDFMESVLDKGKELRGLKKPSRPAGGPDDGKGGNSRQSTRGGRNKSVFSAADLNEQQKFIGNGYVEDGTIKSLDDYAKELGEAGGLAKQQR